MDGLSSVVRGNGIEATTASVESQSHMSATVKSIPLISVCICTFRRAKMLEELLRKLGQQKTGGLFTFEVVVADNDARQSAEDLVRQLAGAVPVRLTYCAEPVANIARARNKALAHARGDLLAFIDDDEFPTEQWLLSLFETREATGADAVLGPVVPHFEHEPPRWVTKGRFFHRPMYPTYRSINWWEGRTGNVLFSRECLKSVEPPFRDVFAAAGEDVDFFRRLAQKGRRFVWCNEAVVFEHVPASRCTRRYLLRRAALRGSTFPKLRTRRLSAALKSLVALPCYTVALPLLAIAGHHVFLKYLIKVLDHGARLLALAGLPIVSERQT